ncbi:MAG: hypothetical protein MUF34_34055, partial [Polyangiaceae bacterium]|nr:hypothetical protein [Polyangiaceae bacterium]
MPAPLPPAFDAGPSPASPPAFVDAGPSPVGATLRRSRAFVCVVCVVFVFVCFVVTLGQGRVGDAVGVALEPGADVGRRLASPGGRERPRQEEDADREER